MSDENKVGKLSAVVAGQPCEPQQGLSIDLVRVFGEVANRLEQYETLQQEIEILNGSMDALQSANTKFRIENGKLKEKLRLGRPDESKLTDEIVYLSKKLEEAEKLAEARHELICRGSDQVSALKKSEGDLMMQLEAARKETAQANARANRVCEELNGIKNQMRGLL